MRTFTEAQAMNEKRFYEKCDMLRAPDRVKDCWIWISHKFKHNNIPWFWVYYPGLPRQQVNARKFAWNMVYGIPIKKDEILVCFCEERGDRRGGPPYNFAVCVNPWHHICSTRSDWRIDLQRHLERLKRNDPGIVTVHGHLKHRDDQEDEKPSESLAKILRGDK